MSKKKVKYRREWHCSVTDKHYSETREQEMKPKPPLFPTTDYCPECAIKREKANWEEVE